MTDSNAPERKPSALGKKAAEKNLLNIDIPTLMVILTALLLLPLLATGFISQ